jgi:Flp pilus assembly protein TadD
MFICTQRVYKTVVLVSFSLLLTPVAHAQTTATTAQLRPALQILDSTKDQDGLMGAVRRVKTEYARINLRDGRAVEGPRQLLELTTYGVRGNRVDNVSYPVTDPTVGREEYKYDDRGNIIEKVLRDDHGTVLSREAYDYVFDEVGNWTKMVTNLVVIENGQLKREPTEVTYRTLTYYANETSSNNIAATKTTEPKITEPKTIEAQLISADTSTRARKTEESKAENKPAPTVGPIFSSVSNTPAEIPAAIIVPKTEPVVKPEEDSSVAPPPKSTNKTETETVRNPAANTTSAANSSPANTSVSSGLTPPTLAKAIEFYQLGRQRFDSGDVPAAIDAYLESVKLEPNSAEVQMNLGLAYLTLKKDKDAMKAFRDAVRLNPELAEAYYGLGFSSFRANKYREATEAFKKAVSLIPDMAKAHYGLALAYIELNKMDDMLQEYRILQRLDSKLASKLTKSFPDVDFSCKAARYCK